MKNGIAFLLAPDSRPVPRRITLRSRIALAWLAAVLASMGGCERASMPSPAPQARALPDVGSVGERRCVDSARQRAWILNSDGVFFHDAGTPEKLVEIRLPSWQWVDEPYGSLPDLAIGPEGEAVVTSNVVPVLWRIDPKTLAVTKHELVLDADRDKDVGFSSLVYSVEHGAFFAVSETHGSLWQIDRLLRNGRKIPLAAPINNASSYRVNADTRCTQGIRPSSASTGPVLLASAGLATRKEMQS